ncbi:hypothetical protein YC2023_059897 [Brassica napus]
MDPHFFSFLILPEKNERDSEKKSILVTFPLENIRSSGDDDLSSGDDDSRSGDDDSSFSDDDSSSGVEVVVGGLTRRHPAGRPAKAYMFCGTGLSRHSEDRSPRGKSQLARLMTNPPRYETGKLV